MKKQVLVLISTMILIMLSAGVNAQDNTAKAKGLTPPDGKALIYVFRPSSKAFAIKFPINVDDRAIATLGSKDFGFIYLSPGKHQLKGLSGPNKASVVDIEVEAGKTYYYLVEPKMGALTARAKISVFDAAKGPKAMKKCSLADNNQEKL